MRRTCRSARWWRASISGTVLAEAEDAELVTQRVLELVGLAEGTAAAGEGAWAVRRLFEALGRERPLLLVFEDVHWAEPTLLDLIEQLAERATGPILAVCIARPELLDERPVVGRASARARAPRGRRVGRAARLAPGRRRADGRSSSAHRRGHGGQPALRRAALRVRGRAWPGRIGRRPALGGGAAREPARPARSGRAGAAPACCRRRPRVHAPRPRRALSGRSGGVALGSPVRARPQGLRPSRPRSRSEEAFRFHHVLVRDVAYNGLPKADRARLHERYADWLDGEPDAPTRSSATTSSRRTVTAPSWSPPTAAQGSSQPTRARGSALQACARGEAATCRRRSTSSAAPHRSSPRTKCGGESCSVSSAWPSTPPATPRAPKKRLMARPRRRRRRWTRETAFEHGSSSHGSGLGAIQKGKTKHSSRSRKRQFRPSRRSVTTVG